MNPGIAGLILINEAQNIPEAGRLIVVIVMSIFVGFIWGLLFAFWKLKGDKEVYPNDYRHKR